MYARRSVAAASSAATAATTGEGDSPPPTSTNTPASTAPSRRRWRCSTTRAPATCRYLAPPCFANRPFSASTPTRGSAIASYNARTASVNRPTSPHRAAISTPRVNSTTASSAGGGGGGGGGDAFASGSSRFAFDASVSFSASEFSGGLHFATTASCAARPSAVRTAPCHGAFAATMGRAASAAFRLAKSGGSFGVNARGFSNLRARASRLPRALRSLLDRPRAFPRLPRRLPRRAFLFGVCFGEGFGFDDGRHLGGGVFELGDARALPPAHVRRAPPTRAGRETPAGERASRGRARVPSSPRVPPTTPCDRRRARRRRR